MIEHDQRFYGKAEDVPVADGLMASDAHKVWRVTARGHHGRPGCIIVLHDDSVIVSREPAATVAARLWPDAAPNDWIKRSLVARALLNHGACDEITSPVAKLAGALGFAYAEMLNS